MESVREINVLSAYQPFLHILTIYNTKHFKNNTQNRCVFRHICHAIVFTTTTFGYTVSTLSSVWYCNHYAWDLNKISLPFSLMLTVVQLSVSYTSLAINNQVVENLIDCLHRIVNKRKGFDHYFKGFHGFMVMLWAKVDDFF